MFREDRVLKLPICRLGVSGFVTVARLFRPKIS